MNFSLSELIFFFVLALLVLGPKRLPEVGRTMGKFLSEIKRASSGLKESIETELKNAGESAAANHSNPTEAGTKADAPKS